MRKRKPQPAAPGQPLYLALAVGILLVIGLSVVAIWQWRSRPLPVAPSPVAFYPTPVPSPTLVTWPTPWPTPFPTQVPPSPVPHTSQIAGTLLFSDSKDRLGTLDDGKESLVSPTVVTKFFEASPDRRTLAYIHDGQLHLIRGDGTDQLVTTPDTVSMLSWSPDGNALAFVVPSSISGGTVYRLSLKTMEQTRLLIAPNLIAPPIWHPSTPRLLIAEAAPEYTTIVYTIASDCASYGECEASRQDFATLSFPVQWLDYHPSGLYIVATDVFNGNMFLIGTAKKDVKQILNDGTAKQHPIFSPDGSQIVYMSNIHYVYEAQLSDMSVMRVLPTNDENFIVHTIAWRY